MRVVALGGSTDGSSWTEDAIGLVVSNLRLLGVDRVDFFRGDDLDFVPYRRGRVDSRSQRFLDAIRMSDAVIVGSPGYHGTVSGLVKNALDYIEELRDDPRPYFQGMPVGTVSVAYAWPAAINTLSTLRDIVHSLRGWPTSMGLAVNSSEIARIEESKQWPISALRQAEIMATQLTSFTYHPATRSTFPPVHGIDPSAPVQHML